MIIEDRGDATLILMVKWLKSRADDQIIPALLFIAVVGCFVGMAMTPDKMNYPDLNLTSENLVRLEAQYQNRVEIINRGQLIQRQQGQILIRNQDDNLVFIPFSTKTKLEGFGVDSVDKISIGSTVAVKQIVGDNRAVSIRLLND